MISKLSLVFQLMRYKQYSKNILLFLPIVLDKKITDLYHLKQTILLFIAFSIVSSIGYIINDIIGKEEDRLHITKRTHPLASNNITNKEAYLLICTLTILCLPFLYFLQISSIFIILGYFFLVLLYTFIFKKIPIFDILILSFFYIIRLILGAAENNIELTIWTIVLIYALSLFLSICKRRVDYLLYDSKKNQIYNIVFLDSILNIVITIIILLYLRFCTHQKIMIEFNSDYLYLSTIIPIFFMMRYLYLIKVVNILKDPVSLILSDSQLKITILIWVICLMVLLYL